MKRPYNPGQALAWIDPHPDGLRVHRATVIHIERVESYWHITTDRGDATVDDTGNSGNVIPIDRDIAIELYVRGDGYLVHPTYVDRPQVLEMEAREFALDADLGDDFGLD